MSRHWSGLPYLDALRPLPGWVVEWAVLTTYSADLTAVVTALLALAGLDDERGSGSKVDFASAYEQLRGRVQILIQAGQIGVPGRRIPILAILDRFIVEINPENGIWHPKIALVKFASDTVHETADQGATSQWRLWIGSRNLTRSLDWDAGMVLVSDPNGSVVPGIAELGAELARLVGVERIGPEQVEHELAAVRWQNPKGVEVRDLRLLTTSTPRGLPRPPKGIKRQIVISPFLDSRTVTHLGRWGDHSTTHVLLSTRSELARLHVQASQPLSRYTQLLALSAPEPEEPRDWADQDPKTALDPADGEELEVRGLHAKLIYAEHQGGRTMWLGSANATTPGWDGPNTEVVAQLDVHLDEVSDGLQEFLGMAQVIDASSFANEEPAIEDPLDTAHWQVAQSWEVSQHRSPDGPRLVAMQAPHPEDPGIVLEVGLLACDVVLWPRGQFEVQLPPVSPAQETELVQIQLRFGEERRAWIQRAPLQPPPDETRDYRAFSRYLDPRTFLQWLRALLSVEAMGDEGGDWDAWTTIRRPRAPLAAPRSYAPTLEEVLQAWSRNPASLEAVDRQIERYMRYMREHNDDSRPGDEQRLLDEFEETWQILRRTLLVEAV